MFDWQSLNGAQPFSEPFQWCKIERCFPITIARSLAATFPGSGFSESIGRDGRYRLRERTVIEAGRKTIVEDLAQVWKDALDAFLSQRYRSFLSKSLGADLSRCSLRVRLYRYDGGSWMLPHTDPPDRVTTHLSYLSEQWSPGCGGELVLLKSLSMEDIACVVPPEFNTAVMFRRSESSFHAVRMVPTPVTSDRLVIIAQFIRSSK